MDTKLSNYGWSGLDSCSISNGHLLFADNGIIINDNTFVSREDGSSVYSVDLSFLYNGLDVGLVLWYNEVGYIKFTIDSDSFQITRTYNGREILLRRKLFSDFGTGEFTAPANGEECMLSVLLNSTNIKCSSSMTSTLTIFDIEDSSFPSGSFGVYGSGTSEITGIKIYSDKFTDEDPIIVAEEAFNGPIMHPTIQDGVVVFPSCPAVCIYDMASLESTDLMFSVLRLSIPTLPSTTYTFSFKYSGGNLGVVAIEQLTNDAMAPIDYTETTEGSGTGFFTFSTNSTSKAMHLRIYPLANTEVRLWSPQVEAKPYRTSFALESREDASVTFPLSGNSNISTAGGLSLWVKPMRAVDTVAATGWTLFSYGYTGDVFIDYVENAGAVGFQIGSPGGTLEVPYVLEKDKFYHIICTWENGASLNFNIYDGQTDTLNTAICTLVPSSNLTQEEWIQIGGTTVHASDGDHLESVADIIVDTLVLYNGPITVDKMKAYREEPIEYDQRILVHTNLDKGSLITSLRKSGIPAPRAFTPVIVEDSGNEVYERVYFVDNGEYVVYDEKTFTYSNDKSVTVDYSEFVNISASSPTKVFDNVTYKDGKITVNDLVAGDVGDEIVVRYTPKKVYCANWNEELGTYEIEFSDNNCNGINIIIEETLGATDTLVNTIEANPFKAASNNGFIYVIDQPVEVTTLSIKASPGSIVADGQQVVTITVDCAGENGVSTSNANLVVSPTLYGTVEKYVQEDEVPEEGVDLITDEHRSGRFIFKYRVNRLLAGEVFTEKIVITDTLSGIGSEAIIKLISTGALDEHIT